MVPEALGFFACLFLYLFIGLGPALWLVSPGAKRLAYALGIAPVLGAAVIGLLAFPLARFVAPVQLWALPVTLGLVGLSLSLAVLDWRRRRAAYREFRGWPSVGLGAAWVALCGCVLAGPLLLRGMQYAAFRANPSDAFLQMSLSEALRVAEWRTLAGGAVISADNLAGLEQLADASPTAMFAARNILRPLSLSKVAAASWAAAVTGLPLYRFYHAHNLLSFALAVPLVLVVGDLLQSARWLKALAAAAVALGFWPRFVLESDAGYEIAALPMLLLAVFAWIQLEQRPRRSLSPERALLAGALAVVAAYYFALLPLIALAFLAYYAVGLGQGRLPWTAVWQHGLTALGALLLLALSGQIDFAARNWLYLVLNAGGEAQYPPYALWLLWGNDLSAAWGLPGSVLWPGLPHIARFAAQSLAGGLGMLLTAAAAVAAALAARNSTPISERVVLAVAIGSLMLAAAAFARDNHRAAGKAFTYGYPYLILWGVVAARYLGRIFRPPARRVALGLFGAWLGAQFVLGVSLQYNDRAAAAQGAPEKSEDFNLAPLTDYLDAHRPQRLLVTIPRARAWTAGAQNPQAAAGWAFAYYAMFAFSPYRPYFQSGLIVDNSIDAQNMWLQDLSSPPDYAVILKEVDYIGPQGLGEKVAETPELNLYRLTAPDLETLAREERRLFAERERATGCFLNVCRPPGA